VPDQVPFCWSSDFIWTAVYKRICLTVGVISSYLRKIRLSSDLPERNYCASSGVPELLIIQGVPGGTDQISEGCSLC